MCKSFVSGVCVCVCVCVCVILGCNVKCISCCRLLLKIFKALVLVYVVKVSDKIGFIKLNYRKIIEL